MRRNPAFPLERDAELIACNNSQTARRPVYPDTSLNPPTCAKKEKKNLLN